LSGDGCAAFTVDLPAAASHEAAAFAGTLDGPSGMGLAGFVHVLLVG
jgi:hypothetical protein